MSEDPRTDELRFTDPGFRRWVSAHDAVVAIQAGLPPPYTSAAVLGTRPQPDAAYRQGGSRHRAIER